LVSLTFGTLRNRMIFGSSSSVSTSNSSPACSFFCLRSFDGIIIWPLLVSIVVIVWKMPLLNHHVKAAAVSKDFGVSHWGAGLLDSRPERLEGNVVGEMFDN